MLEGDFESPDAAIVLGEQTIGVEVTEIQKSVEERARRAPKDDILQRAKRDYEAPGRFPISATFSFNESEDLRQINRADLGRKIADVLVSHDVRGVYEPIVLRSDALPFPLRGYFREIRFWGETVRGVWQCSEATWVSPLTHGVLQQIVDRKRDRLATYWSKGYDAYWLLICAHPTNPACRFEASLDFDPSTVVSDFDRTFFFDAWHAMELGLPSK